MSEEEKIKNALKCLQMDMLDNTQIELLLNYIDKLQDKLNTLENKLEEHIKFCEQEASGHLDNNICHISLKFCKNLLDILNKE